MRGGRWHCRHLQFRLSLPSRARLPIALMTWKWRQLTTARTDQWAWSSHRNSRTTTTSSWPHSWSGTVAFTPTSLGCTAWVSRYRDASCGWWKYRTSPASTSSANRNSSTSATCTATKSSAESWPSIWSSSCARTTGKSLRWHTSWTRRESIWCRRWTQMVMRSRGKLAVNGFGPVVKR